MSKPNKDQRETTPGSPKRTEGGLDYQSGKAGTRKDVTDPQKDPEDLEPHERLRGASNRDDEDDGHS